MRSISPEFDQAISDHVASLLPDLQARLRLAFMRIDDLSLDTIPLVTLDNLLSLMQPDNQLSRDAAPKPPKKSSARENIIRLHVLFKARSTTISLDSQVFNTLVAQKGDYPTAVSWVRSIMPTLEGVWQQGVSLSRLVQTRIVEELLLIHPPKQPDPLPSA